MSSSCGTEQSLDQIRFCASCNKPEPSGDLKHKACSRCKKIWYCGGICQRNHWKEHKKSCGEQLEGSSSLPTPAAAPAATAPLSIGGSLDPRVLAPWAHVHKPQQARNREGPIEDDFAGMGREAEQLFRSQLAPQLELLRARSAPSDDDNGALYQAFERSMPPSVKCALLKNEDSQHVSLTPEAQWLYTAMHAWATSYTQQAPGVNYRCRFAFQDRGLTEFLLVDVHAVLRCPEDGTVPHWGGHNAATEGLATWRVKHGGCSEAEAFRKGAWAQGRAVRVVGLTSRPGLNGRQGVVTHVNFDTMRYCVEIAGGEEEGGSSGGGGSFNLKQSNVRSADDFHEFDCDAPLVLVRYLHSAKPAASFDAQLAPFEHRSPSFRDGWLSAECVAAGNDGFKPMWAESAGDVRAGLAELERHEALLSANYLAHFQGLSPYHRPATGGRANGDHTGNLHPHFRPSFLVPPRHVPDRNKLAKQAARCANSLCAAEEDADSTGGRFTKCSQCLSALYCSKHCQKTHWKSHKAVCGKSAQELEVSIAAAELGRESFVFAIDCCPDHLRQYPPGWQRLEAQGEMLRRLEESGEDMYGCDGNLNFGSFAEMKKINVKDDVAMPRNVYGDGEFVVKVQVPTDANQDGSGHTKGPAQQAVRCMVYDRRKTFGNQYFGLDNGPKLRAFKLVKANAQTAGLKAYFMARRQGTNIRVYVDRVLPPPAQPW